MLLRGGAAFSAWAAYARERVWRRGAYAAADARCSRALAARALLGRDGAAGEPRRDKSPSRTVQLSGPSCFCPRRRMY